MSARSSSPSCDRCDQRPAGGSHLCHDCLSKRRGATSTDPGRGLDAAMQWQPDDEVAKARARAYVLSRGFADLLPALGLDEVSA